MANAELLLDACLYWPGGGGEAPCTQLYADTVDALDGAQAQASAAEADEDWDRWGVAEAEVSRLRCLLDELRHAGHLGESVQYDKLNPLTALLGGAVTTVNGDVYCGDAYVGNLKEHLTASR